jgi:hypothetical protein
MGLFKQIMNAVDAHERLHLGKKLVEYALDILPPSPIVSVEPKYQWSIHIKFEDPQYEMFVLEYPALNEDSKKLYEMFALESPELNEGSKELYKFILETKKLVPITDPPKTEERPDYVQAALLEGFKVFEYNLYPLHGYSAFLGTSWEDGGINVDEHGRAKTDCLGNSIGTALIHDFDPDNAFHCKLARVWYYGK